MIGIFDSGFGGLTVLRELRKSLPQYDYLYLGDQLHNPYGGRSREMIEKLTEKGVNWLFDQGAKLVLIACNTASADALRALQHKYPERKILGVLVPAVEKAITPETPQKIGILATTATHLSGAYLREIASRGGGKHTVLSHPAPLLVPLIEEGWTKSKEAKSILEHYLTPLKEAKIDTLILGCTHYPLLQDEIENFMHPECRIVSSSHAQSEATMHYLAAHPEIECTLSKNGNIICCTTDSDTQFTRLGSEFLGEPITAKLVEIE